jgi:hypothetical protein
MKRGGVAMGLQLGSSGEFEATRGNGSVDCSLLVPCVDSRHLQAHCGVLSHWDWMGLNGEGLDREAQRHLDHWRVE